MKKIRIFVYFMRLVRWPNLLLVVATMALMRYALMLPLLQINGLELQLSFFHFVLLVFSTVMITAAGYIINDYFDRKTDLINKPYKVIVGRFIKRRAAMLWHAIFNAVGVLAGAYISFKIGLAPLGLIFVLTTGLLWFYSTNYKRQVLLGNLLVALFTAMVPLLALIFEFPLLTKTYGALFNESGVSMSFIKHWVLGFAYFAFILTLVREIVKDAEDLEGDTAYGRSSIPIALGFRWTKTIVVFILALFILSMTLMLIIYLFDALSVVYLSLTTILPAIAVIYLIATARSKKGYTLSSLILKLMMAGGVLYSVLARYIILNQA